MNRPLRRASPTIALVPPPAAPAAPAWRRHPDALAAAVLLVAAFAIRSLQFGNPYIQVDETFYLLVGDRMLHGAVPYVDIWDRKPVGLFLIYAAIRLLGGVGIVQYQVVATLFAAATAIAVMRVARPMAGRPAATLAGVCYLLMLGTVGGTGGQSPVFYNLPVAVAALLVARLERDRAASPARVRWTGAAAMLLVGLAMQIKYSPVFEGVFLGVVLLRHGWRAHGGRVAGVAADAALWIALALAPTAAALAWYAAHGQARAFLYANFLSIGSRNPEPGWLLAKRLLKTLKRLALPLAAIALAAAWGAWRHRAQGPATWRFALGWFGAALLGYLLFGSYFDHYALPLLVPMAVLIAPALAERRWRFAGAQLATVLLVVGGIAYATTARHSQRRHGGWPRAEAITATLRTQMDGTGSLYVWGGDTTPYLLTGAAIPTRWPFPSHLSLKREEGAIGTDQLAEIRRIMDARPRVLFYTTDRNPFDYRPEANALFLSYLPRYRLVADFPEHGRDRYVYRLRD